MWHDTTAEDIVQKTGIPLTADSDPNGRIAFDVITQQYDAQIGVIISVCRFVLIDVINGRLNIICCCRSIGKICSNADLSTLTRDYPVELAYALALIWADDAFSITPPWLLKTFPRIENVFKILRNTPCNGQCEYCSSALDIHRALKRIFNYDSFRLYAGAPLQERAVQAAVDGKSLLAVFPTGGGKSLTFQLPCSYVCKRSKRLDCCHFSASIPDERPGRQSQHSWDYICCYS